MGYKLFSDVTADVSEELMRGMPEVELVPMQVELGGENYIYGPGGDLTVEHFYAEQRAGKFASTSQINPMVYRECFEKTLKAGEDILYLCFSSGLSSTLQSANLCAQELREEYPERKLIVVDTLCAAVGEAMLVREAARKQQEGLTIEELAAVSSSGNLIFLMVGLVNGISMGAGVVIARYFGAKDYDRMQKTIHTLLAFGLVAGALLTVIGMMLSPVMLRLMDTPETVLPNSISYFRTYFTGSLAFVLYNICMGILQAVGDSRHPLQYLIISSIVNIALDLLFVGVFHMGVGSAAAATAISQLVSMSLCMIRLMRSDRAYRVNLRKIRFDGRALREILQNGLPAGLQNSIISIANVVVQSNINQFGAAAMAGCGAHSRIEGFGFLPVTCFTMALTTFVSQNLGAKAYDRVKKGIRVGIFCSVTIAETIALLIFIFSPKLIGLFTSDAQSIAFGVMHERTTTPFFFLLAYSHCMAAIFRGAGKSTVPMLVMLLCWCIIRVTYVTFAVKFFPVLQTVSWAYPITWGLSTLVFTLYYFKSDWMHAFEKRERRA